MGVQITEEFLAKLNMTRNEFLLEVAVHLYDIDKMSMGQARNFAGVDQITFQKEMKKRNVFIKYDVEDLEEDLRSVREFDELIKAKGK